MKRLAVLLPFLALFLAGCDDKGNPNTDVEAIVYGALGIAVIAAWCFILWLGMKR